MTNIKQIVDEVTKHVLAVLETGQTYGKTGLPQPDLIILFGGHPYKDEEIHSFILNFKEFPRNTLFLLDPEIEKRWKTLIPYEKILLTTSNEKIEEVYKQSRSILVPFLPFAALGKLALLIGGTLPINLVTKALQEGKTVYTFSTPPLAAKGNLMEQQIAEYWKQLVNLGLKHIKSSPKTHDPCSALTEECNACGSCPTKIQEAVESILNSGACRIGTTLGAQKPEKHLAKYIDHTLLKPDATTEDVNKLCAEARQFEFASVCVNPSHVALSKTLLHGSPVKVCTVIGFPLGATTTIAKVMETRDAIANGAEEIDMVINVGAVKAKKWDLVKQDIEAVREASEGYILKVILETALLTDEEKIKSSEISKEAGADFVKTSTGFGPGGATEHDVALMRQVVGEKMGVKASGGIRDYETAQKMIDAGATRIGASASVAIVQKKASKTQTY